MGNVTGNPQAVGVASINGMTGAVQIGANNLFAGSRDVIAGPAYGATLTSETGVTVPEWGAADAIRIYGKSGTSSTGVAAFGPKINTRYKPTEKYVLSMYVKNDSDVTIYVGGNFPSSTIAIEPHSLVRYSRVCNGYDAPAQFGFSVSAIGDAYDITYWHPQLIRGTVDMPWSEDQYDLLARIAALEAKVGAASDPPLVDGPEIMDGTGGGGKS